MSYKSSAASNRDALFGGASGGGGSKKTRGGSSSSSSRKKDSAAASATQPVNLTSKGYSYGSNQKKKNPLQVGLSGEAKTAKMKEADDYRDKAKKAMQKGLFKSADPLTAATYWKRAADAYQLCGELKLERMYRMNSADCQMQVNAFATAAAEYTRAAELFEGAEDETIEMKREVGRKLHLSAADAWRNMNEPAKAASSAIQAALALIWGDESSFLPKMALEAIEEAVESFVPDPLNPYARYRQTGVSAFINPDTDETAANPSSESLELAKQQIVIRPYAHEPLQEVMYMLLNFSEYASALYVAGAITAFLSQDGVSTLTLSRSFVAETIITLAMGDPVAAEENFLKRHVQKSSYLTSRECKLAEELFRAVKTRDDEALEEARSVKGSNRSAIGNLPPSLKEVLAMIRISGVARKGVSSSSEVEGSSASKREKQSKKREKSSSQPDTAPQPEEPSLAELAAAKTGYEDDDAEAVDTAALQDELAALDFGDDESSVDDDDLDLR